VKPRRAEFFTQGDLLVKPYRSPGPRRVLIRGYAAPGRTLQAGAS